MRAFVLGTDRVLALLLPLPTLLHQRLSLPGQLDPVVPSFHLDILPDHLDDQTRVPKCILEVARRVAGRVVVDVSEGMEDQEMRLRGRRDGRGRQEGESAS